MGHFWSSVLQKRCTVATFRCQSADSTALLELRPPKTLYCRHFSLPKCRQYSTFGAPSSKNAVLSPLFAAKVPTVQHFWSSVLQKRCTVATFPCQSADSTALLELCPP